MTIHENFELAPILRYQFGGKARYMLECKSSEDILQALEFVQEKGIERVFVLGTGSNLIFTDSFFDGAILLVAKPDEPTFKVDGKMVTCYAGEMLDDLILFSFEQRLVGLEWAGGLPGTVGAAVRGNVGAYGGEIKDSTYSVEVAVVENDSISVKTIMKDELHFEYRGSLIKEKKNKMVVLSANFALEKVGEEELTKAREEYQLRIKQREDRHPLEYPNCGSVFKNIREQENIEKVLKVYPDIADKMKNDWYGKIAMGYLIQRMGLQGYRVGNAQISTKHALFIVNLGGATFDDVTTIIKTVQQKCEQTFGFIPEVEVEIVE
jgi:UDP-N-acetylmuramate dehydrogenase